MRGSINFHEVAMWIHNVHAILVGGDFAPLCGKRIGRRW